MACEWPVSLALSASPVWYLWIIETACRSILAAYGWQAVGACRRIGAGSMYVCRINVYLRDIYCLCNLNFCIDS